MHFGYLNRNWVEELVDPGRVPTTASSPAGPIAGSRRSSTRARNRNLFTVAVPKDFGKKEVIWTLIANGKTQKAFGWLQPEWEIDPAGGADHRWQTRTGVEGATSRRRSPSTPPRPSPWVDDAR